MSVPQLTKIWAPNEYIHAVTTEQPGQKFYPEGKRLLAAWNVTRQFSTEDLEAGVVGELIKVLKEYLLAQSRMADRWADADDTLRAELWRDLHAVENTARAVFAKVLPKASS